MTSSEQIKLQKLSLLTIGLRPTSATFETNCEIDTVATYPLALHQTCDSPQMGCARRITMYVWHEQPIIE